MTKKIKKVLIVLSVIVLTLLILAAGTLLIARKAVWSLSYEGADEPTPEIDESFASHMGISFPDREPIHDPQVINVLLLGTDVSTGEEDSGRADSNILCSLDTKTGDIRLISFERGIGVPVPDYGSDILTHAYRRGGPELSQSILSQMFCVEIAGYARVDFEGFAKIVDLLGGIDIELTEQEALALNGAIPTQTWTWQEVHEGVNHLYGHDVLEYCRLRSIDSDWNRQQRQRTVLAQIRKRCASLTPMEFLKLSREALPLVHTNLSQEQVASIAMSLPKVLRGSVTQLQVPDKNFTEGYIRCDTDYESKKIANFLYDAGYEISSPY